MDTALVLLCIQRRLHKINVQEILFLKASGRYCTLHTDSKKIKMLLNLGKLSQQLPARHFSRVHRGYLVAWEKIKQITSKWILIGNEKIPLTRGGRKILFQLLSC
ncbi:LytTR family DNA-binding domain-containing protein [Flavihumibacter sp. CACIAM 22H1]|uniref:LytR/AlgR family response regulator transcription factor n=1 Tax=Flavihumibacter sp. CACIAM 22H1 TaxID=1812911 RepID=UPI0007A92B33|nr:MAG: hypothetical protein A1D16_15800 [Flavihumibacter sp. CACIAM 22H1]